MATILALDSPHFGPGTGPWLAWFPLLVSVVPALLMVMTVRFRSFRDLLSPRHPQRPPDHGGRRLRHRRRPACSTPGLTSLVVAYGYVLTAPLGVLTAPLRERWFGPDSVAPPRRRMPSVFLPLDDDEDAAADVEGPAPEDDGCADDHVRLGHPCLDRLASNYLTWVCG